MVADERNDSGTTPALILFVIIMQDYPDQCSLSTLGSLSQSRRQPVDDAPCPVIPLDHFFSVHDTPLGVSRELRDGNAGRDAGGASRTSPGGAPGASEPIGEQFPGN